MSPFSELSGTILLPPPATEKPKSIVFISNCAGTAEQMLFQALLANCCNIEVYGYIWDENILRDLLPEKNPCCIIMVNSEYYPDDVNIRVCKAVSEIFPHVPVLWCEIDGSVSGILPSNFPATKLKIRNTALVGNVLMGWICATIKLR